MPFWRRSPPDDLDDAVRLVVGLGNPGGRYEGTRHNIGFMVVNRLAQRHGLTFRGSKHRADTARGTAGDLSLLLALPVTYMNESGSAVSRLTQYYHVSLDHLLVVFDDIDLPFGTLRLRAGGSSGGQRGLESIIGSLGSNEFARLRVGVGRPPGTAVGHVLGPFPPGQRRLLPALLDVAADAVLVALREGIEPAMNRFNRSWLPDLEAGKVDR